MKTVDTKLNFTTNTSTSNGTTTTNETAINYSDVTRCKYYLPCGECDKTGELCTYYIAPSYPYYPNPYKDWWLWGPTWYVNNDKADKDYIITTE